MKGTRLFWLPLMAISLTITACGGKSSIQTQPVVVQAPQKYCPRPLVSPVDAVPDLWEQEGEESLKLIEHIRVLNGVIDCYEGNHNEDSKR